ncbi:MAG: phage head closure protein [Candidatus Omnitrophota bacterium]|jgi:SPP1 family predicted phage head-tail adaptor
MNAGELRQRLELQAPITSTNDMLEVIHTFATQATVWGAVEPLSGNLLFTAQQTDSEVQGRVRIRYRSDIQPTWRIKYGNRYLQILSIINPNERNRELHLLYKESLD